MGSLIKEHKKYKWFYTSSGKLVIGGKSASQNDDLLKTIKKLGQEFFIMHTAEPGSPFSVILSDINKVKKSDLDESAVFTGCFSRAWRSGKKHAVIDIFSSTKLFKSKLMPAGTWGVSEVLSKKPIELELVLTTQDKTLRAVPKASASKSFLAVSPGKVDKTKMVNEIKSRLKDKFTTDEILSALPAGGVQVK